MSVDAAAQSFAPKVETPYSTLALSVLRVIFYTIAHDFPGKWSLIEGRRNPQADLEGPFYLIGAPNRQLAQGKGIIASPDLLKKYVPFLATIRVLTPDGKPIPNVTLDWWQADSEGGYYHREYKLRGTVTTDAEGVVEVLTVPPGAYGPASGIRQGHIHLIVSPAKQDAGKWDALTTQLYLCTGNNVKAIKSDFLNYVREGREGNVMKAWCIASSNGGKTYMDLPELSVDERDTTKRVEWWNSKLSELGDVKVVAGASIDLLLNKKSGWF